LQIPISIGLPVSSLRDISSNINHLLKICEFIRNTYAIIIFIDIGICKVHALKIDDIVEMGEQTYNQYLSLLLYDVDLLEIPQEQLKEMQIDKFTTYHFLLLQSYNDKNFRDLTIKAFECFLKEKIEFHEQVLIFYIPDKNTPKSINFNTYELIRKVLIKQNFLEEEEELIFGNEMAKEWYLDLKRKERMQVKPKSNVDLQSIISAVMWKAHKSIDEILNMTIYQLYDGYYRLSMIDSCTNLAQGVYHGMIDQKSIKQNDLNWAKIIKFENNNSYFN
jgi:hypothetical protein